MNRRLLHSVSLVALSLSIGRWSAADCPGGYGPPPPPWRPSGEVDPRGTVPGEVDLGDDPPLPPAEPARPPTVTQGPRPGATPGARAPRGTTAGARRGRSAEIFNWETWWWNNQHRFLDFSRDGLVSTGSSDFFLGAADRRAVAVADPVTNRLVAEKIVPALLAALESRDDDTRAVAVRALGRIGTGVPVDVVARSLADKSGEVRRCAVLALGEAEAGSRLSDLVRLALDESEGPTIRGYAAVSIGLLGDEAGAACLRRLVLDEKSSLDLRITALASLSLAPSASGRELVRRLAADEKANESLRALAAEAVGRLCGDEGAALLLLDLANDRSPQVRRSAVIALASIEPGAERIGAALARVLRDDRDVPARAFAAIALGEHASAPARKALLEAFDESSPAPLRSFAAIGLGLLGEASGAKALRSALESGEGDPSLRSAVALALGLARDRSAGRALARVVEDGSAHPTYRGYAALSLGLIGDRTLLSSLERAFSANAPTALLEPLVKAQALFGADAAPALVAESLRASTSDLRRAILVEAVGLSRDRSFVDPFVAILGNAAESDRLRVYAAVALGRLGGRHEKPPLSALTQRRNYLVPTPTIDSLVGML